MSTPIFNQIKVGYNPKNKKLMMAFPFMLADVAREYPSRKFDPKSKTWQMPLTKANLDHLRRTRVIYNYLILQEAQDAIQQAAALTTEPVHIPFPYHVYDFGRSATGFQPMDHQRRMLDRAWNLPAAAWFAKMGTGKTFSAVHLACARYQAGLIDSVVIICPSTLRATWRKELAKYATSPYDFRIHESKAAWYKEFCRPERTDHLKILAVSVEGLGVSKGLYESVCEFMVGRSVFIINDESSRIKNPSALRTKRAIQLAESAEYKIILNGTPIAVGIEDLWSQYEFLDPNIIGSGDYWSYKTRYIQTGGFENKQIVGYKNVDELMELVLPYSVEVSKDVLNLPPKVMKQRYVTATAEQKKLLKLIKKGYDNDPNSPLIKVDNVLERVLRWRQVVGGWLPRQDPETGSVTLEPLDKNPKMDSLLELIEDNIHGSKFIIWSPFVHEIDCIAGRLAELYGNDSVRKYYGATDKAERSAIEDAYCNDPGMRFFVANQATAGLGLTLISGLDDIMVYYSGTNAYIDRAQSEDRAHRIGQRRSVLVIDMIMEKTVDELIAASTAEKMSIEEFIFQWLKGSGKTLEQMELEG